LKKETNMNPKKLLFGITCGILAALLLGIGPAVAMPQGTVRGQGRVQIDGPDFSTSSVSVDAWLDDSGVAHGTMTWTGDILFTPGNPVKGGPADPWLINVTDIAIAGNTATVCGTVVHTVSPEDMGVVWCFQFADNSETGQPDKINFTPVLAGNIIITPPETGGA
jgi:hypothetical protein